MRPLRYVAYHELGDTPNVIVDGSPQQATVLTLSHWPHSGTPLEFADDLSAQIAFRWLDASNRYQVAAHVVSNNHFDEDGLVSVYVLVDPDQALARRELLCDIARAGDFGTWHDRAAARVALTINAFTDPDTTPLDSAVFQLSWAEQTATFYRELLPRLAEWCDHPERARQLWQRGDADLQAGLDALASRTVTITERPDVDLAIVTIPEGFELAELALHHATDRFRLLLLSGQRYELRHRYETWVQYRSRRPLPRVDLAPLADRLTDRDPATTWSADPVDTITPRLTHTGPESGLDATLVTTAVIEHLTTAPAAWNPYNDQPATTAR